MKRILLAPPLLILVACTATVDTRETVAATRQADSISQAPRLSECINAQQNAMHGRPDNTCKFSVRPDGLHDVTDITVVFDKNGFPFNMTGTTAEGLGFHSEYSHQYWPGRYDGSKTARGPLISDTFRYYETDSTRSKQLTTPSGGPDSLTIDGRVFYLTKTTEIRQQPGDRYVGVSNKYPEYAPAKYYETVCGVFLATAESDDKMLVSEMGTKDGGNNWRHTAKTWTAASGDPIPRCTGRYDPYKVNTSYYDPVRAAFLPSSDQLVHLLRDTYSLQGLNFDKDPLSLFPKIHDWAHAHRGDVGALDRPPGSPPGPTDTQKRDGGRLIVVVLGAAAGFFFAGELVIVVGIAAFVWAIDNAIVNEPPSPDAPPLFHDSCTDGNAAGSTDCMPPSGTMPHSEEEDITDEDEVAMVEYDDDAVSGGGSGGGDTDDSDGSGPGWGGDDPNDGSGGCVPSEDGTTCPVSFAPRP